MSKIIVQVSKKKLDKMELQKLNIVRFYFENYFWLRERNMVVILNIQILQGYVVT